MKTLDAQTIDETKQAKEVQSQSPSSSIWRPFMSTSSPTPPRVISGKGAYLTLEDGTNILDAISSWWVTLHGHTTEEIAEAISKQAKKLEQVIFANFSHHPAETLLENLIPLLPSNLQHPFFSDNGSTSVEVAIKMAYEYFQNIGEKNLPQIISFDGGYHGDTLGAMSVSSKSIYTKPFAPLLFPSPKIPYPGTFIGDKNQEETEALSLQILESNLKKSSANIVIIEPLIQGAAGMRMCSITYLQKLQKLVHKYNGILIYDEVMTGFGRTGEFFACTKSNTKPDIICLSKGITGGFLPLALTVATKTIYDSFANSIFYHGHSYTANPIACSAAIASLELLQKRPFDGIEEVHTEFLKTLPFKNKRVRGTIAAFEVENPKSLQNYLFSKQIFVRPLGNTVYCLPPFCITRDELSRIYGEILKWTQT